jgi:hypothetical protein
MDPQFEHALLSRPTADERGRESFLAAMRRHLITDLYAGNQVAYEQRQAPRFEREHGRPPESYIEVKRVMERDPYYRAFSLLNGRRRNCCGTRSARASNASCRPSPRRRARSRRPAGRCGWIPRSRCRTMPARSISM